MNNKYIISKLVIILLIMVSSLSAATQKITIKEGWNLVGSYLDNKDIKQLYTYFIKTVWKWGDNGWKFWSPNELLIEYAKGTVPIIEQLDSGEGFWIDSNKDAVLILNGDIPQDTTLEIKEGWNLLSLKTNNTIYLSTITKNFTIWKWSSGIWKIWSSNSDIINILNNLGISIATKILPDEGFWIKSEENISSYDFPFSPSQFFSKEALMQQKYANINSPYELISKVEPAIKKSLSKTVNNNSVNNLALEFFSNNLSLPISTSSHKKSNLKIYIVLPKFRVNYPDNYISKSSSKSKKEIKVVLQEKNINKAGLTDFFDNDYLDNLTGGFGDLLDNASSFLSNLLVNGLNGFLKTQLSIGHYSYKINLKNGKSITTDEIKKDPLNTLLLLLENGDLQTIMKIYPIASTTFEVIVDAILQGVGFTGDGKDNIKNFLINYYLQ